MGGFVVGIWGSLADTHHGPRLFDITKSNPPEVCVGYGEGCMQEEYWVECVVLYV